MAGKPRKRGPKRRGTMLILVAVMAVPLLAVVACAIDYGYLLKVRTDLQRTADAAALAAVQDLIPGSDGAQDLHAVRAAVRAFATANTNTSFQILDSDIEIGRYDPDTIYTNVTLLNDGIYDTVRVTARRDARANARVSLFFARALGVDDAPVTATATAVLQKATALWPGADVLPFAVPLNTWNAFDVGDEWYAYGDGKLADEWGNDIPGNWGTLDIGSEDNSTDALCEQILEGLRQDDLDALHENGRIPSSTHIAANQTVWMQGDPGLSVGIKSAIQEVHGLTRIVPLYDALGGDLNGGNLEFHVVRWGVVTVVDSNWGGEKKTYVTIRKSYAYQGDLRPQPDLTNTANIIEAVFTSPVLVE